MHRFAPRLALALATTGSALVLLGGPAGAHVGTSAKEVPAGGSLALGLTIGHGCDGSPTTSVAVQLPEGVNTAKAFAKPGWTITSEKEALETPIEAPHGDPITERVSVITFTAAPGGALPDELRDTFTINFTAPETPGEQLYFKTVQTCEAGEIAWIQEYDGTGEEPESPAPSVLVTEAAGEGDGHGGGGDEEDAAVDPASDTDDKDGTALAVVALAVGVAGLAVGGTALAKSRKTG